MVIAPSTPAERVLLIDPDATHRVLISRALVEHGFDVVVAVDGRQGLEYFHAQPIDLVIVDVNLPDISGLDVCTELSHQRTVDEVPVLVSGMADDASSSLRAFESGAQDYLHQPMSPEEICARIGHTLSNQRLKKNLSEQNVELSTELNEGQRELDGAYRRLKLQLLNQRALFDVSHQINSSIDVDEQINILLLTVMGQLVIETAAIFLVPEEDGALQLHSAKGVAKRDIQLVRLEHEDAMFEYFEQKPRPLDLTSASSQVALGSDLRRLMDMGFVMALPIITGQRLGGLLILGPKAGDRSLDDSDLMLLSSLLSSAGIAMEKAALFKKLQESYIATIQSLMSAMEAKDTYTRGHTARVSRYALAIAEAMGFSKDALEDVRLGATLHDIGKIGIHEGILNKEGKLTSEELEIMKEHPALGDRILRNISFLQRARKMVRHHHERWDGQGYPDGLKGEEISLGARIVSVADAFDAMTSKRTYSEGMGLEEAIWNLTSKMGTQFYEDAAIVFVRLLRDGLVSLPSWMKE